MLIKGYSKFRFTLFSIILFSTLIGFIIDMDFNNVFQIILIYIIILFIIAFNKKKHIEIEKYVYILVGITVISHFTLGEYLNLYYTTKWFDKLLHVFGSFSFALFFYSIFSKLLSFYTITKVLTFIFITLLGISAGAIFEIIEFLSDSFLNTNLQNGLLDTNLDIIGDVIGSVIAGIFGALKLKYNHSFHQE